MRIEAVIMELAAWQHGVVSRQQLLRAGVRPSAVDRRVRLGLLRPLHRGVFQAAAVLSPLANVLAAVLACDGRTVAAAVAAPAHRAMASHHTALGAMQLIPLPVDRSTSRCWGAGAAGGRGLCHTGLPLPWMQTRSRLWKACL